MNISTKNKVKMKTLIVVAHPDLEKSNVNKKWIEKLKEYPDKFTVHELYKVYPDEEIHIEKEQKLIEEHDKLILQFPMYWFNCPPLLKKWFDDVFTYGWAYGSKGNKMKDKKVALGISAGIKKEDFDNYPSAGSNILNELTSPYRIMFAYTKSHYHSYYVFLDANNSTKEKLEIGAQEYIDFILSF